jgi:hypothetical protein
MLATLLRALQIGLGALCLYLAYVAVAPLLSTSPIGKIEATELGRGRPADTAAEPYGVIATRNLFQTRSVPVALDASDASELDEEHPESKLRIVVLGTMASTNPKLSIASVQDETSRETLTVRVGDDVKGAEVEAIERRRIVLRNRGKLEQVTLEDEKQAKVRPRSGRSSAARSSQTRRPNRVRQRRPTPAPAAEPNVIGKELMDPFLAGLDLNTDRGEEIKTVNGIARLDANGEVSGDFIGALLEPGEKSFVIVDSSGTEREVVKGDSDR